MEEEFKSESMKRRRGFRNRAQSEAGQWDNFNAGQDSDSVNILNSNHKSSSTLRYNDSEMVFGMRKR